MTSDDKQALSIESEKETGPSKLSQRLLEVLLRKGKHWPIADWHVPSNDPRINWGTHFASSSFLASEVANKPIRSRRESMFQVPSAGKWCGFGFRSDRWRNFNGVWFFSSHNANYYYSVINDRLYSSITTVKLRVDWRWFIHQLEVLICFWSSAAWPPTSCTWAFPLCILSSLWWTTIVFAKLNKPPSQISLPSLLTTPPPRPVKCVWNK